MQTQAADEQAANIVAGNPKMLADALNNTAALNGAQFTPGPWSYHFEEPSREWALVMAGGKAGTIVANVNLLDAMKGLFQHCSMIHKHWGDGSNQSEAAAAIAAAHAAIARAEGGAQ